MVYVLYTIAMLHKDGFMDFKAGGSWGAQQKWLGSRTTPPPSIWTAGSAGNRHFHDSESMVLRVPHPDRTYMPPYVRDAAPQNNT